MVFAGHSWPSIQHYSLSEIGAFIKAVTSINQRKRREDLSFDWMASNVSQKSLKKILSDMEKEDISIKKVKKKREKDPSFVDSEWKRLMKFQRGMR